MALHLDNTTKLGHEPTHKTYTLSNGTPLKVGRRTAMTCSNHNRRMPGWLWANPAPQTGICTCDEFMKHINRHRCDMASTVAIKDPENKVKRKCAPEHTSG